MKYAQLVSLSQGLFALVSEEDLPRVLAHKWSAARASSDRRNFYAVTRMGAALVKMHRFLTDAGPGTEVDHLDGDGLNCARQNLVICGRAENANNLRRTVPAALSVDMLPPCVRGYTFTRGIERVFPRGVMVRAQPGVRYTLHDDTARAGVLEWSRTKAGFYVIDQCEADLEAADAADRRRLALLGLCDA